MPRARKKPTLTVFMSEAGKADLDAHVEAIREAGAAAKARRERAASASDVPGAARPRQPAAGASPAQRLSGRLAKLDAKIARLKSGGAYLEADRLEGQRRELAGRLRNAEAAEGRDRDRAARQDRFRTLVERSAILTGWHVAVADRWLEVLDQAAGAELQTGRDPEEASEGEAPEVRRDPVTGRRLPEPVSGPAMYVRGLSVLDRWGKAVPRSSVELHGRKVPPTFDPKRRNVRGGGPSEAVPERALRLAREADQLGDAFASAILNAGHPVWCEAVALRVIRSNETLRGAFTALGVAYWQKNQQRAQTAMAAGLSGVAEVLGMGAPR